MAYKEFKSPKLYNEYVEKITHQEDVPQNVQNLWNSILALADASETVGAVGNSGEFHTDRDEIEAEKKYSEAMDILVSEFEELIGYKPVYVKVNETFLIHSSNNRQYYETLYGYYKFEKV